MKPPLFEIQYFFYKMQFSIDDSSDVDENLLRKNALKAYS